MSIDYEPIPSEQRDRRFKEDQNKCRLCGAYHQYKGGNANLEVHHITPTAEGGTHELDNLTTLCFECHRWYHSLDRLRSVDVRLGSISYEPSPIDLLVVLAVAAEGPTSTSTIAEIAGSTIETTSQRLYKLTALEVLEPSADLHNHKETAQWGFRGTVPDSAVGRLPSDPKKSARLVRDDMMRRRADRGVSHGQIAEELGLSRRTVYKGVDRARALRPPVPDVEAEENRSVLHRPPEALVDD